ncbi:hypothetical protein GCM10023185_10450 [Hymenobacter saemangeumensis]|uniref:DUF4476 domain-containing protein n=1 Tax=Hymenobacter saemangeumensis TaxID=1084522 RepID=A0ABP8I561_9BACT
MNKAFLLALSLFFAVLSPGLAAPLANASFSGERGLAFTLVLDGRPLTRGLAREVYVDRLVPGLHWADFTIPAPRGGVVRFRSRVWLEPGLETNFLLQMRPGRPPFLRQIGALALYGPGPGAYPGGGYHNGAGPYGQGGYNNGGYAQGGQYDDDYDNNGGYSNGGAGYYPGSAVSSYRSMAPQDVDALIQAVRQRPFESAKLSLAKDALSQSSLSAVDLKRLLRSFDFESSRVELAKYAHSHVYDPQNFYRVYEGFDFDASVREVQRAVGGGQ